MNSLEESLSRRAISMLLAVRDGRAQLAISCEPDLFVDGIPCCDQATAHLLARSGLIQAARQGSVGERVAAIVTDRGFDAITCQAEAPGW